MSYTKVTDEERQGKGVTGLPDVPQLSTADMQAKFDELGNVGIDALNNLIDELEATTGADSLGATVPEGLVANPNVGSILEAMIALYNTLEADSHTHTNKATLDEISSVVKTEYDRLVAVLQNVDSVNNGVIDDSGSIPTGHAIVNYVSQLGGGDMLKAVYDRNNSGVVDNSEAVQGHTVTTSSAAITSPTQQTGAQLPTASAINSVYTSLNSSIDSKVAKSSIKTSQATTTDTVPSSSLLKSVTDSLTNSISILSGKALQVVDRFTVKSASSSSIQTHDINLEVGKLYIIVATTHKMTANGNPGTISGTIGVSLRYMDRYEKITSGVSSWVESIVAKDLAAQSNFTLTSVPASRKITAKATAAYMAQCTVFAFTL